MKTWLKMLGVFLLIVLVVGGVYAYKTISFINVQKAKGIPKTAVTTTISQSTTWKSSINVLATLSAERGAVISSEVEGMIEKIWVDVSADVSQNDVLVSLRAGEEKAKLASLQAQADLAVADYVRDKEQVSAGAVSAAQLDNSLAQSTIAKAAVAEQRARLAKYTIRAPYSGSLGIMQVRKGQWIVKGSEIVSLQNLDTLLADFSLPQSRSTKVKVGDKVSFTTEALKGEVFEGKITAINSQVDEDTRTILLRARIPNADHRLLPGYFGQVSVVQKNSQDLITLPQTAIVYSPYGQSVYLVKKAQDFYEREVEKAKANNTDEAEINAIIKPQDPEALLATQVFVKTGARRGDQIAILSGVKAGDEVITSGQVKLKNGSLIVINNAHQPSNDRDPKPVQPE